MRRFLDPVTTSGHNDSTDEIVELKTRDSEMHFEAPEAQRDAGGQHGGNSSWDVEADGAKNKSFFHKEGGGYHDGMGIFCFLANLWPACRSRVSRNFTKRLKDGEEQSNSPSQMEVSHAALGHLARMRLAFRYGIFQGLCSELYAKVTHSYSWIGAWSSRYRRSLYHMQVDYYCVRMILMMLFALIILGRVCKKRWDSRERQSAVDNLEEFQEEAKSKRLNMWQYGDIESNDEESTKPVKAGGRR